MGIPVEMLNIYALAQRNDMNRC